MKKLARLIRSGVVQFLHHCASRSKLLNRLLRSVLEYEDLHLIREILHADNERIVRALLAESNHATLKRLLFENEGALFRKMLWANRQEPLQQALLESDFLLLCTILDRDGRRALREILFQNDYARLRELIFSQHGTPFRAAAVSAQGDDLLYRMLSDGNATLLTDMLERQDSRLWKSLLNAGSVGKLLLQNENAGLRKLLLEQGLLGRLSDDDRLRAGLALDHARRAFANTLLGDACAEEHFRASLREIRKEEHVPGRFLDSVMRNDTIPLRGGAVRLPDRQASWSLLHEIILNEDYYFESGTETPRILDCGAHVGMAIYYFKTLYPKARITAFEPVPVLREIAEANARSNGYTDVEILPYALAEKRGTLSFYVSEDYSMAGSLHERRAHVGDSVRAIEVECRPLTEFLHEPVDFLKLDIEGTEDLVLAEAEPLLGNVHYLFCEYHHGAGLAHDRLARILAILERAGLEVNVGKSFGYQESSRFRPMNALGGHASEVIWARNRAWDRGPRSVTPE